MRTLTLGMGIGPEGPTFELCEKIQTDDGQIVLPMADLYMQIKNIEEVQKAIDTINRFSTMDVEELSNVK